MNKTKVIIVAVLCLLVGVVGGVIVDRIFYGYKLAQHFNNNDAENNNSDSNSSLTDESNDVPKFNTEFNYDNFYETLITAGVKNRVLISEAVTNDNITLIYSKSYEDFANDKIEYDGKTIYFNAAGMSFNEVESTRNEGDPLNIDIKIFKMGEYFLFYGDNSSSTIYNSLVIYDKNMDKVIASTYSIKIPVISNNVIYFETLGDPITCLDESYAYMFDSRSGQTTKVFTMNRTKQLVC